MGFTSQNLTALVLVIYVRYFLGCKVPNGSTTKASTTCHALPAVFPTAADKGSPKRV
jgi:hypothetical protein